MQAVAFSSINTGWVGGSYGYLYKTTDGGLNFARQNTGTNQAFWGSIYCFNDSVVWGVGGAGKIMHTTTSGQWLVGISNNENEIPKEFALYQNYPNPFNNSTMIKYQLSLTGKVKIKIFDISGKEVETLLNKVQQSGKYEISFNAYNVSSGIYFYSLYLDDIIKETKRMILIK
jgi:hypothetical protein